eukprot:5293153-Amphidinium_carterae.1
MPFERRPEIIPNIVLDAIFFETTAPLFSPTSKHFGLTSISDRYCFVVQSWGNASAIGFVAIG